MDCRANRSGRFRSLLRLSSAACLAGALYLSGCGIRPQAPLITVYNPDVGISISLPQGWSSEATQQGGFYLQSFTGMSVDVTDRPGIRVQVMVGPTPSGQSLDGVAKRYIGDYDVRSEGVFDLHGFKGQTWEFGSEQAEEAARLMLTDVEGTLYGLYARGEERTVLAYGAILDVMWDSLSIERADFFDSYDPPGGDVVIKHPRSWSRTTTVAQSGESLFVGFRSEPLAVETDGTTVHATLEITVNSVGAEVTVESFYDQRSEALGENYRLVNHRTLESGAISVLYRIETQLSQYLERTVYFVRDGKSYIYKATARVLLYRAVEAWIDEIVTASIGSTERRDSSARSTPRGID